MPEPDEQCTHLTHPERRDPLDALTASLNRSSTQTAAIDHLGASSVDADIDTLGPPPPSTDVLSRVAWIAARRNTEQHLLERSTRGIDLAAGR